ncbi:unnamed protein product [Clonostachys rosea]|uniref:VWFA domain-containing protein n=1 Tax=Bionectria ochroleuca TaxID=29856 RepID=A0ABY6UK52_BIOOC|nr:unnamed protein product [Clonostachys rosea]
MWSIGCIIVEAAVWLAFGERGRQDFIKKRKQETSKLIDLRNLGYSDCFHDGSAALRCIGEYVDLMKHHGRQSDEITRQIVKLATKDLLIEEDSRINSLNLFTRLRMILNAERHIEMSSPSHPNEVYSTPNSSTVRSEMHQQILTVQPLRGEPGIISPLELSEDEDILKLPALGTATQPVRPGKLTGSTPSNADGMGVSIDQLISWINVEKTGHNNELPGWKLVQDQLKGRHFCLTSSLWEQDTYNKTKIFLIDNSNSMQEYRTELLQWVFGLGYLVKKLDPDRGEIRCTSDLTEIFKFKKATDARNFVSGRFVIGKGSTCNMEEALYRVVDNIRRPAHMVPRLPYITRFGNDPKKTTLLVFTDGVWNSSREDGVMGADAPIESLIKHMKQSDIGRPNISIQFLRFGSEPVGIRRLESLDDDLGKRHEL